MSGYISLFTSVSRLRACLVKCNCSQIECVPRRSFRLSFPASACASVKIRLPMYARVGSYQKVV